MTERLLGRRGVAKTCVFKAIEAVTGNPNLTHRSVRPTANWDAQARQPCADTVGAVRSIVGRKGGPVEVHPKHIEPNHGTKAERAKVVGKTITGLISRARNPACIGFIARANKEDDHILGHAEGVPTRNNKQVGCRPNGGRILAEMIDKAVEHGGDIYVCYDQRQPNRKPRSQDSRQSNRNQR